MTAPLVECVPNISEGRDLEKINAIVDTVRANTRLYGVGS